MSLAATNWPAATVVPLRVSVPAAGSVVIFTACRLLPSVSLKPKSAVLKE